MNDEWKDAYHDMKEKYESGKWDDLPGWRTAYYDIKRRGKEYTVRLMVDPSDFIETYDFIETPDKTTPKDIKFEGVETKSVGFPNINLAIFMKKEK